MMPFRRRTPGAEPLWRRYLRFHGPDTDADVDDELRFHLEMCALDLERQGHAPHEARRIARERFGEVRTVRSWLREHDRRRRRLEERMDAMDALVLDVRYAVRRLRTQPGFTLAVVLVLGLGIGAATAMFSAVDAALLRPLPFQRDERLVALSGGEGVNIPVREFGERQGTPYIGDARALREVFTHVAAYAPGGLNLSGDGAPVRARVALVTPDLFATLGVRVARGRGFSAAEGVPDGPKVAILSDALWRSRFGADPTIVGRDVRLNDVPHRVVGVMPPRFGFPQATELWLPLTVPSTIRQFEAFRGWMPARFVARLAPGATIERAEASMVTLVRRFQPPARRAKPLDEPVVRPLRDTLVGERRTPLLVLMGATALVLLVACANVTNLLLSRAVARRGELALRAALGARRGRLVRQLLVESLLLAVVGGLLGVLLALAGTGALAALMPPELAGAAPARVDGRVLAFSLACALLTGLLSGLWPAIGASRAHAAEVIKSTGPTGTTSREGAWTRRSFVIAELALAVVLAVGAGLMLRSLQALLGGDMGVRPATVATLELTLPNATYARPPRRREFFDAVLTRLQATPGVEAAAAVNELPLRGERSISVTVEAEGRPRPEGEEMWFAQLLHTSPDYFRTLGIPLLQGRTFATAYDSAQPPEVIVNESLAQRLWPGENPIGRRLTSPFGDALPVVVGVVGDVRAVSLESERTPQMYYALAASPPSNAALLVRGSLPPRALAARLQEVVRTVSPSQAVYNVRPMTEVIAGAIAPRRTSTILITAFGVLAVGLAALGVYGVIAYGVARRTREIGIRAALGARPGDLLSLVVREGVLLAVLGVALGLAGAWALRRVLGGLLYGITADDPVSWVATAAALFAVAVLATVIPARQALRVDPARAIRAE